MTIRWIIIHWFELSTLALLCLNLWFVTSVLNALRETNRWLSFLSSIQWDQTHGLNSPKSMLTGTLKSGTVVACELLQPGFPGWNGIVERPGPNSDISVSIIDNIGRGGDGGPAHAGRHLPLPKRPEGLVVASQRPKIWECRFK